LYLKLIEEKILELKNNDKKWQENKIETKIDLNINIFIEDEFFNSELDKINFYREIEYIKDFDDLENLKKEINKKSIWLENLLKLIELKLFAKKYFIKEIKKVWINYIINFYDFKDKNKDLEKIKNFLELDKEVKFVIKDLNSLKTSTKNFANNEIFLNYMLDLFKKNLKKKKIKLVKMQKL
jgi:transcription-repair coupling factor (superfamily II helicase)